MKPDVMLPAEPLRVFLDKYMARRDIGRRGLAGIVGLSDRTVERLWDAGGDLVSLFRADRLLAGLGFHLSYIYDRHEWEPEPEIPRTVGPGSTREHRARLAS